MLKKSDLPHYYFGDKAASVSKGQESVTGLTSLNYFHRLFNKTTEDELYMSEPDLSRIPSPTSSLASNKKLEWDSGADIGYNILTTTTRKCKSFPTLSIMDDSIAAASDHELSTVFNLKSNDNDKIIKVTKDFIHSTPNPPNQSERQLKAEKLLEVAAINNKCIQTDSDILIKMNTKSQQTSSRSIPSSSNSSSTTPSLTKSTSFQYLPGILNLHAKHSVEEEVINIYENPKHFVSSTDTHVSERHVTKTISSISTAVTSKKSCSENCSSSSSSDDNSEFGKIISIEKSDQVIDDIEKCLEEYQKMFKSNPVDEITKKKFIKKIVKKILLCKYAEDTSSSNISQVSKKTVSIIEDDKSDNYSDYNSHSDLTLKKHATPVSILIEKNPKSSVQNCQIKVHLENIRHKIKQCKLKDKDENTSSDSSYNKNWREDKTKSERLLEQQHFSTDTKTDSSSDEPLTRKEILYRKKILSKEIKHLTKILNFAIDSSENSEKIQSEECVPKKENKLSEFLTIEQIKTLINNALPNACSCNCNKSHKTTEFNEKEFDTYRSHTYDKRSHSTILSRDKTDASIQCTLKTSTLCSGPPSKSTSTSTNPSPDINTNTIIFMNENNFENTTSSVASTNSTSIQSCIVDNTDCKPKCRKKKSKKHPIGYFLELEETSNSCVCDEPKCEPKKPLPKVKVKVPKIRKTRPEVRCTRSADTNITLQEYLIKNRPDFIINAEDRRRFICDQDRMRRFLYSTKEMKDITSTRYRKLPEVQNKIKQNKEQSQRRYNRIMASDFSKKLQKRALAGQVTISTRESIISNC